MLVESIWVHLSNEHGRQLHETESLQTDTMLHVRLLLDSYQTVNRDCKSCIPQLVAHTGTAENTWAQQRIYVVSMLSQDRISSSAYV